MLKREWGTESNGKLPHLFIPSKTATFVPEFAVEDLPLDITATLVPAFIYGTESWFLLLLNHAYTASLIPLELLSEFFLQNDGSPYELQ